MQRHDKSTKEYGKLAASLRPNNTCHLGFFLLSLMMGIYKRLRAKTVPRTFISLFYCRATVRVMVVLLNTNFYTR